MGSRIPKAIEPHFNSIISHANSHAWLVQFYHDYIRGSVRRAIEHDLFESELFRESYPYATSLDKLYVLKDFFDSHKKSKKLYVPLKAIFKDISAIHKQLQDAWFKAMVSHPINLADGLPSYTPEVLHEVMTREIILYMKRDIDECKEGHQGYPPRSLEKISHWVTKELQHLGPVSSFLPLDNARFKKIHDPSHQELDAGALLGDLWYFANGTHRTPLFLQYELLAIKSILSSFKDITYALSLGGDKFTKNILIGLPIACVRFGLSLVNLMFAPYRLARTMVNELTELCKLSVYTMAQKLGYQATGDFSKGMSIALEWGCYIGLLWAFSLPLLPNPLAWMPVISEVVLGFSMAAFAILSALGACALSLTDDLTHNPLYLLQQSVEKVEFHFEKGIKAVDEAHQKIFHESVKPSLTPQFSRQRREQAQSQEEAPYQSPLNRFHSLR